MISHMKKCRTCGEIKSLDEFHRTSKKSNPDGRINYCKDCREKTGRRSYLKRRFGITPEDYESMLEGQGGGCAICGRFDGLHQGRSRLGREEEPTRFAVDHCHKTGVVRGLLCMNCNTAIGCFQDNTSILEKAIEYLQ